MGGLQSNIVLEILGRPANHVKESLSALVNKLGTENGIKIIEKKIHEPIPAPKSEDLFTTFAEITLEMGSISDYINFLFAYMPSHSEIIHPEKLNISNVDISELGNKLTQRLHDYDAITKKSLYETQILTKKLQEVAPHLFKQNLENSQKKEEKTYSKTNKSKAKKKK